MYGWPYDELVDGDKLAEQDLADEEQAAREAREDRADDHAPATRDFVVVTAIDAYDEYRVRAASPAAATAEVRDHTRRAALVEAGRWSAAGHGSDLTIVQVREDRPL